MTTIGEGKDFVGCLAHNDGTGVGFLAVGDKVAMFGNSAKFAIAKGEKVSGTWSVDDGSTIPFESKADSARTVTMDVPNSAEMVAALTTGSHLNITANAMAASLSLEGSDQAFAGLITCMQEHETP